MSRLAVVLFNLGGPDGPQAVRPFLFNLFNDKAIIGAPKPIRWLLAQWISRKRAPLAQEIYAKLGGGSPLLGLTRAQAQAIETRLGGEARVFIAMRYWHPMTEETVAEIRRFAPERIVLLPLYPHYSSTTTGSSLQAWRRAAGDLVAIPTSEICCYPTLPGLIEALAQGARQGLDQAAKAGRPRLLFSAHGLPKRMIARGDPYQAQIEMTARAVVAKLAIADLDWTVCYQSRVGPLEWIGPATLDEIDRAGQDRVPLVVLPVAFVSEHSETLVELDIEYRDHARKAGVPAYVRVPALGTAPAFIDGLVSMIQAARPGLDSASHSRDCPKGSGLCPRKDRA
ncbi:MAG: ferrochelatase [Rhodospirillales bacterium]|nr:ferrochelatase [Rhodospirillales bacterium]